MKEKFISPQDTVKVAKKSYEKHIGRFYNKNINYNIIILLLLYFIIKIKIPNLSKFSSKKGGEHGLKVTLYSPHG